MGRAFLWTDPLENSALNFMDSKQRQKLLTEIRELVGEHCEHFVFVAEIDGEDSEVGSAGRNGLGGKAFVLTLSEPTGALGLMERARHLLLSDSTNHVLGAASTFADTEEDDEE